MLKLKMISRKEMIAYLIQDDVEVRSDIEYDIVNTFNEVHDYTSSRENVPMLRIVNPTLQELYELSNKRDYIII